MRNLAALLLCTLLPTACQTAPAAPAKITQVVVLEHTHANEMADTLNQFIGEHNHGGGQQMVAVRANGASNSLLVAGTEEQVGQVTMLIAQLDKPAPQNMKK